MYGNIYDDWGKSAYDLYWTRSHEEYYLEEAYLENDLEVTTESLQSDVKRNFHLDLLQGRFAQIIVENILKQFDYEVFPFGYESYLTNIIQSFQKPNPNEIVSKIRCSPDSIVYNKTNNTADFLEIKSTSYDLNNYFIKQSTYKKYLNHWPDALLTVVNTKNLEIFVQKVSKINLSKKTLTTAPYSSESKDQGYYLDLYNEFISLANFFEISDDDYRKCVDKIKERISIAFV